mgnify:CR=1 FL=1|jgi:hypothetical protein|tara:strand:- start:13157 stop:13855 length:699 start_codon:yes stop_codon:yes gene_type:complete
MAIDVNKVYRVVLAITNKEQRGYLTPDQFNRIARQAQLDIYEKTFYDYNRAMRKQAVGDFREYSDIASNIKDKIDIFARQTNLAHTAGSATEPTSLYRLIGVFSTNRQIEFEEVRKEELPYLLSSNLNQPTESYPVYYTEANSIKILPTSYSGQILIDYLTTPSDPEWVKDPSVTNRYEYSSSLSTDFEIHESDETDLVIKILAYTGVIIKDPTVIQVAAQKEINDFNQDNV